MKILLTQVGDNFDFSSLTIYQFIVERFMSEKRLPHLLLYGPPGTGKTSTILAAARGLFAPNLMNSMVLEVNEQKKE